VARPGAQAAIVIDDLGQNPAHLPQLAALNLPLSVAVIPGLPATADAARDAARFGFELLLHQPMEPEETSGKDPGPGALLTTMIPEEVRERLRESLAAVPGAVGVNNHMGSRFTADLKALGVFMAELKKYKLFWLDSRTTSLTRGSEAARAAGVAALERDIFLDAQRHPDFIRAQIRRLVDLAVRRGSAVGIGHPYPETFAALGELRDELLASGVSWVPVSALVGRPPTRAPLPALAAAPAERTAP
jgi:polysaccharide deacetylase 2 family uncharacterized protein YibQ